MAYNTTGNIKIYTKLFEKLERLPMTSASFDYGLHNVHFHNAMSTSLQNYIKPTSVTNIKAIKYDFERLE